jgi:hypothetical protein
LAIFEISLHLLRNVYVSNTNRIGVGRGEYPTIKSFEYKEQIEFSAVPNKPIINYIQKTWSNNEASAPLHSEFGYLRIPQPNLVEWLLVQPSGISEIDEGKLTVNEQDNNVEINVKNKEITRTSTAKPPHVTAVERIYTLNSLENTLSYRLNMSTTTNAAMTHHLSNKLSKKTQELLQK